MSNDTTLYTVGEVAERFSLTVRTLRHWEGVFNCLCIRLFV